MRDDKVIFQPEGLRTQNRCSSFYSLAFGPSTTGVGEMTKLYIHIYVNIMRRICTIYALILGTQEVQTGYLKAKTSIGLLTPH